MQPGRKFTLIVVLFGTTSVAYAGWPCSIDHAFPEVSELQVENGRMVADLGISKLANDGTLVWTNYVPDLSHPDLMREISCDQLYADLLSSNEFAAIAGFDIGNAFDVFWQRLTSLRPEFMRRYMRELHGHPADKYPRE